MQLKTLYIVYQIKTYIILINFNNLLLCFSNTGYFFIIWLAIKSTPFTPQYLNMDSEQAAATKEDTVNEVTLGLILRIIGQRRAKTKIYVCKI